MADFAPILYGDYMQVSPLGFAYYLMIFKQWDMRHMIITSHKLLEIKFKPSEHWIQAFRMYFASNLAQITKNRPCKIMQFYEMGIPVQNIHQFSATEANLEFTGAKR